MPIKASLQEAIIRYDEDAGKIKLALFAGQTTTVEVKRGCASVGTSNYFVSDNFPDGSILSINVVETRGDDYPSLLVRDVLKYGTSSLQAMPFGSRLELLDLLCTSMVPDYGFSIFGGRCVAPRVYVAIPITFSLAYKCQDDRLVGVTVYESGSPDASSDVLKSLSSSDVDSVENFPPVPNEDKRLAHYKPLIQSMIRKMCGKWKDVYLKSHTPGQLPFDADDLMQQGMMEALIAIRKFNANHVSKAKESTFVYRHLWNRFGHIAHKYSKKSRGYGVTLVRDFIDEDGNVTTPYDLGSESNRHGYLGNTDY